MSIPIYSFNSVDLSMDRLNELIVVCDIDNTIFYTRSFKTYAYFYKLVKSNFPNNSEDLIYADSSRLFNENRKDSYHTNPVATDLIGFLRLLDRIREIGGKIIYLTARPKSSASFTKTQFESIGLYYDDSNTHYTNNTIHKGDYLNEILEIDRMTPIIFIDDLDENLNNVLQTYPNSKCYKFIYDNPNINNPK